MVRCTDSCCTDADERITGTLLRSTLQVARKRHKCDRCSEAILPRTVYRVTVAIIDGDFCTERTHDDVFCEPIWRP